MKNENESEREEDGCETESRSAKDWQGGSEGSYEDNEEYRKYGDVKEREQFTF